MREALLREYGRTVAIFAAAGLVLSLLVGLLARNPFGIMLLRAVLLAIAFGGVGAGMQYVVRRFLPEIMGGQQTSSAGAADAAAAPRAGSTVDIVLPEEPLASGEGAEARSEPLEELPGTGDGDGAPAVEELDGAEPPPSAETAAPVTGQLDELPEFDPAGATAAAERGAGRRAERVPGSRAKPSDATRDVLERQDPAVLARGLRTMLKRDERP